MKSFVEFLNENVDTLDTLHDPGIKSYYSRHRVTPQSRIDMEIIRKIISITLESGPTARRKLTMYFHQLASTVPEIKPLVDQLGVLTNQDAIDAKKLFDPKDIEQDLGEPEEEEEEEENEVY